MTQTAVPPKSPAAKTDGKRRGRHQQIRTQILEYLARNGASRLSDITNEVTACRDTIRSHLTVLENAAIVRSNIPAGTRARTTPFYSLAPHATLRGVTMLKPPSAQGASLQLSEN
jgi:predicted ArsR family transcriptional regulator